ncbi:hypothetical protein B0H14DRAFT_3874067 [Mycena olivaceomarginata]|nr:hypothetical protein B0H14DRAFT_3874067 [Mycena olivaceomarginata]
MASFLLRLARHVLYAYTDPRPASKSSNPDLSDIFVSDDGPARTLAQLVKKSGGTWPPSPTFNTSWPAPLRVYHAAYEINRRHACAYSQTAVGDAVFDVQCGADMASIVSVLEESEASCWVGYDEQSMQSALLGFCACVCFLRLAYRWGVSPVVREAQIETSLSFPPQLDEPWLHLQRIFGFTSPGGGLSSSPPETANWDARLFLETEHRSLPMYRLIAETISACSSFTDECPLNALASLKEANVLFQNTSRFFFENMKDTNISHALWLAYLQGYTGWALPDADGVMISGVSGGHSLTIRTLDAFLGIKPAPPPEEEALHLPAAQRDWLNSLRNYDIRAKVQCALKKCTDAPDSVEFWQEMQDELQKMVQKLRLWRMGHMTRMVPYEGVHRPERVFMTAGRSIPPEGEASDEAGMVEHLKEVLQERLVQTV